MKWPSAKEIYECVKETVSSCTGNDIFSHAAALAYYTVFAIAPLFVIALAIAGLCFGEQAASRELFGQVGQLIGKDGASAVQTMVTAADHSRNGFWATALAVVTLVIASTGVFAQLQISLNHFWGVSLKPGSSLRNFIRHRLLSFAMVWGIGFLLLVSLVISAGVAAVGNFLGHYISTREIIVRAANPIVSLVTIAILFTMIFKILPDVKIAWRDVWLGGFVTAVMFNAGKYLIGFYIARSSVTSVYGAVGSLVIILAWVYYSALILYFGAHLTRVLAERYGTRPQPIRGATLGMKQPAQHTSARSRVAHRHAKVSAGGR